MEPDIIPYGDTSQPIKLLFTVFFHGEISVQIFLMRILRTSGRKGGVVAKKKTVKSNFIGCEVSP